MTAAHILQEMVDRYKALPKKDTGSIRNLRREFSKRLTKEEPQLIFDVARILIEQEGFSYRFMAYELVAHHKTALSSVGPDELEWLRKRVNTWYDTDTFAPYIAGPAWREEQVSDDLILGWARSTDMWTRRTAVVCTIALNNKARGGRGDTPRTLMICDELLADRSDMVEKAVSWALRELAKRDQAGVQEYWERNRELMAARVRREVKNKLVSGTKSGRSRLRVG